MSIQAVVALHRGGYYSCPHHLYLVCEDKKRCQVSGFRCQEGESLNLHMKLPEIQGQFHVNN